MGKPSWSHVQLPLPEHIGQLEGTWGSETSQYPQEEKTKVIPRVVASEIGTGQTREVLKPAGVASRGLWGRLAGSAESAKSKKSLWLVEAIECRGIEGETPVDENLMTL